jgi:hypothetical protein
MPLKDHAIERTWRQLETVLKARPTRVNCQECGVHTARLLLRLSWESVQRIIDEAVEIGLVKKDMDKIQYICMDA